MKLRTILVTAMIASLPFTAFAADDDLDFDQCTSNAVAAGDLMRVRQAGVLSMVVLMNIVNEKTKEIASSGDRVDVLTAELTKKKLTDLVIRAYKVPHFTSEEIQRKVIMDFENEVMMECLLNKISDL